ncbi:MAG: hypothetical protein AAF772_19900, partial [Acidobacteriota bacterium]
MTNKLEDADKERSAVAAELTSHGFPVDSIWAIGSDLATLRAAVPVLAKLLPDLHSRGARFDIIHLLTKVVGTPEIFIRELTRIEHLIQDDHKLPHDLTTYKRSDLESALESHEAKSNGYTDYGSDLAESIRSTMTSEFFEDVARIF